MAPNATNDNRYEVSVPWAFVSFRPANDWLIRVGKQRIPFYLYSETVDVGVTYDFARLPTEMYSIISSNDFTGLSISKTWAAANGDVTLDGYWGKEAADYRYWARTTFPSIQTAGAVFGPENLTGWGIVLSYKSAEDTYRIGVQPGDRQMEEWSTVFGDISVRHARSGDWLLPGRRLAAGPRGADGRKRNRNGGDIGGRDWTRGRFPCNRRIRADNDSGH